LISSISIVLFFLVLRFTVTLFNFISNPKLTRVNRGYNDLVSILIPARNEEQNIAHLLKSIYRQDYKNYEVIVYDAISTDQTYSLCSAFAANHTDFRVIKGTELPDGWLGKNYACDQLAVEAKGDYLLFLDAEVVVHDDLINSAVHRMKLYKLSLLSLFPNQEMQTIGEKTTVPLLHYLLLSLLPLRLVFLIKNAKFSTACGQFMLFDADKYRQNQWHSLINNKVVEDTEIMKKIKTAGYNGDVLLANGMISCRMYKNYREAITGFSKNALAVFNYSIPGLLIFVTLLIGGPMLVMATLNFNLMFFMIGLILLMRIMISLAAGQKVWYNILFHPVQMANFAFIAFLSIQKHLTKTIVWKGREFRSEKQD
jgi:glycosyltransferase involved in cell wall biosynthesis